MNRKELLREAERLIYGQKNQEHGDPDVMMARVAALWSAYKGVSFTPHDVAAMMILLKVSRIKNSPDLEDSWIDIAGYAACGAEVAPSEDEPEADYGPGPGRRAIVLDHPGESWEYRDEE
jgi:hypothetical protein